MQFRDTDGRSLDFLSEYSHSLYITKSPKEILFCGFAFFKELQDSKVVGENIGYLGSLIFIGTDIFISLSNCLIWVEFKLLSDFRSLVSLDYSSSVSHSLILLSKLIALIFYLTPAYIKLSCTSISLKSSII